MPLCTGCDQIVGYDRWCYICEKEVKKSRPMNVTRRRDYFSYIVMFNVFLGYIFLAERGMI